MGTKSWFDGVKDAINKLGIKCELEKSIRGRVGLIRDYKVDVIDLAKVKGGVFETETVVLQDYFNLLRAGSIESLVINVAACFTEAKRFDFREKYKLIGSYKDKPLYKFTDDFAIYERDLAEYYESRTRFLGKLTMGLANKFGVKI